MSVSNLNSFYRRSFQTTLRRKRPTATGRAASTTSTETSTDATINTTNNAAKVRNNDATINAPFQTHLSSATTKFRDEKRMNNPSSSLTLSSTSLSPSTPASSSTSISNPTQINDDDIQNAKMNDDGKCD